jgi:precorrin-2/cobalt-factor-2 C20-methyltransferase
VGVGPGDPELITLKAHRILQRVPVIGYFAKAGRPSHGRAVVAELITPDTVELALEYPVTTEIPLSEAAYAAALAAFYAASTQRIAAHLDAGRDVAIVSEGDPFFYGSFMHLHRRLAAHYATTVVPGVPAMAAAWCATSPITYGDDVLTVLPATLSPEDIADRLQRCDAAVIMKLGRHLASIRAVIAGLGLMERAYYIEHASTPMQRAMPLAHKTDDHAPYFSMITIVGQGRRP